ncbi:MAG: dipeptidase [Bacteroidales bacterium]|nr:dipeptidase [Bacteroidales bacterium]
MFVLDSHCDTPSQIKRLRNLALDNDHAHVDFPKLRRGGVDASFFALYTPASYDPDRATAHALELLALVRDTVQDNSGIAAIATSPEEALAAKAVGKIAVCIGMENGSPLQHSLPLLREFNRSGVSYLTLCHSSDNEICDSCAQGTTWHGLSPFGREVVTELNRLGMIIDVSHISDDSFWDVLKYSTKPVAATHSCCRALASHKRNLTDEMLRALAAKGGVLQINFYPAFLDDGFAAELDRSGLYDKGEAIEDEFIADPADPEKRRVWYAMMDEFQAMRRPSYTRIADHIDHAVAVAGIDHVGLGSDFDGIYMTPDGLEDAGQFSRIFDELRRRGYSETDIAKIAGGNFLRLWREVQTV